MKSTFHKRLLSPNILKKLTNLLFITFFFSHGVLIAQDTICDDFTSANWPNNQNFSPGDTLGFSQNNTQSIVAGNNLYGEFNTAFPGIYGVDGLINFEFDNTNKTAVFEIYGFQSQFNQMGFSVNGSPLYYLDNSFPVVVSGVTIDIDTTANNFGNWKNVFLTFSGALDNIDITLFESGILSLCVYETVNCDDFTSSFWQNNQSLYQGDTLGYSQDSTQLIMQDSNSNINFGSPTDPYPGIGFLGTTLFEFNNTNQTAIFEIYGFQSQYDQMGFTVNGSSVYYMDNSFPIVVNGVTVNLDTTAVDFGNWDNAFLTFSGVLDNIGVELFESGILSLCTYGNESLSNESLKSEKNLSVYPNPVIADLIINSEKKLKTISFYSFSGELVMKKNSFHATKHQIIDVSYLQSGLYLLSVDFADGTNKMIKIVKE